MDTRLVFILSNKLRFYCKYLLIACTTAVVQEMQLNWSAMWGENMNRKLVFVWGMSLEIFARKLCRWTDTTDIWFEYIRQGNFVKWVVDLCSNFVGNLRYRLDDFGKENVICFGILSHSKCKMCLCTKNKLT
jgi:hypothetical protein